MNLNFEFEMSENYLLTTQNRTKVSSDRTAISESCLVQNKSNTIYQ